MCLLICDTIIVSRTNTTKIVKICSCWNKIEFCIHLTIGLQGVEITPLYDTITTLRMIVVKIAKIFRHFINNAVFIFLFLNIQMNETFYLKYILLRYLSIIHLHVVTTLKGAFPSLSFKNEKSEKQHDLWDDPIRKHIPTGMKLNVESASS